MIAFASQGYTSAGDGNVPALYNGTDSAQAWNKYFAGTTRLVASLFSPAPDYIVCCMGQNGGCDQTAVTALAVAWRAAAPSAKIAFVAGPGLSDIANLQAGVTAASATLAKYVTLGENLLTAGWLNSNHLTGLRGHPRYAAVGGLIRGAFASVAVFAQSTGARSIGTY